MTDEEINALKALFKAECQTISKQLQEILKAVSINDGNSRPDHDQRGDSKDLH
jgi:hypothetical protein